MPNLKDQTISDFGEQWTAFRDNPGYYGSAELLADLFGPLLSLEDIKGKAVADIGSGTGRIVNMLIDVGASRVIAVEPSAAMRVLKENTALHADKIEYLELPAINCRLVSISTTSFRWVFCIIFLIQKPLCEKRWAH